MLKSFFIGSLLIIGVTAPAAAQQPNRPVTGGNDRTVLVAGGLTFMNAPGETGIGVAGNVLFNALTTSETGRIGIVGDAGLNKFDNATVTTIMGGARYTFNTNGKFLPYGQFLLGIVHCCGDTEFKPNLGFGTDIAWKENFNFRGEVSFIFGDPDFTRWFFGVSTAMNK